MSIVLNSYFPCDPPYVTDHIREAGSFNFAMEKLKTEMEKLQAELKKSVPFFSSRYKVKTSRINHFQASIRLFISFFFFFFLMKNNDNNIKIITKIKITLLITIKIKTKP